MIQPIKLAIALSIILITSTGCSALQTSKKPLVMDELIILNNSFRDMQNIEIRVEKVNKVFTCSKVIRKAFCSNRFSPRAYEKNAITLSWQDNQEAQKAGPLVVEKPANYDPEEVFTAIIELGIDGNYKAYFRP